MWSPTNNENALYPAFGSDNYDRSSSLYIQNASYLRLTTLQLGYNVPTENLKGLSKARIYLTADNLFIIKDKDYIGYDPDVSSGNANNLERGFDNIAYPKSRTILMGLDISF